MDSSDPAAPGEAASPAVRHFQARNRRSGEYVCWSTHEGAGPAGGPADGPGWKFSEPAHPDLPGISGSAADLRSELLQLGWDVIYTMQRGVPGGQDAESLIAQSPAAGHEIVAGWADGRPDRPLQPLLERARASRRTPPPGVSFPAAQQGLAPVIPLTDPGRPPLRPPGQQGSRNGRRPRR